MSTKHYITFYFPGVFVSNETVREVSDRDAQITAPPGAYGYRVHSRTELRQDGETLVGAPRDFGPMTYFGEVLTVAEVEALPGDHEVLLSNMRCNGWDRVVRTVRGTFQALSEGDVVLSATVEGGAK
jgi:hypothetical protein